MQTTDTGHEVGATYRSAYWGYTYRVLAVTEIGGVRVQVVDDPNGVTAHIAGGEWEHLTALDRRDVRIAG